MKRVVGFVLASLYAVSSAAAQISPAWPGPSRAPYHIAVFKTTLIDATDQTTYTFNNVDIGDPHATRRIIVACSGAPNNRTLSSATIAGSAATEQVSVISATNATTTLFTRTVTTGTTATIALTWSGGQGRTGCGVWAIYGTTSATAVSTASDGTLASSSNLNINATKGDVLIVATFQNVGSVTSVVGYTENYASTTVEGTAKIEGGSALVLTTEAPRTVTINYSTTPTAVAAVAARFR